MFNALAFEFILSMFRTKVSVNRSCEVGHLLWPWLNYINSSLSHFIKQYYYIYLKVKLEKSIAQPSFLTPVPQCKSLYQHVSRFYYLQKEGIKSYEYHDHCFWQIWYYSVALFKMLKRYTASHWPCCFLTISSASLISQLG